jgi:hypothetical protein
VGCVSSADHAGSLGGQSGVTREERLSALERAHEVRSGRARVKRAVAAGTMGLVTAMDSPCCQTMRLIDLLLCQRKWGGVRTLKVLRRLRISESRVIGDLTGRQRMQIVKACCSPVERGICPDHLRSSGSRSQG